MLTENAVISFLNGNLVTMNTVQESDMSHKSVMVKDTNLKSIQDTEDNMPIVFNKRH